MRYKSCVGIRRGFNFYRSGKITACCGRISPELEIAYTTDEDLPQKILQNQARILRLHKENAPPQACRACPSFIERDWAPEIEPLHFSKIFLNHYKKCNLRCVHCGYRGFDDEEEDTPHEQVFEAIKSCIAAKICLPKPFLEVGGGEPSLAKGLEPILQYALDNGCGALINSNGAKFSPLFASGVNANLFSLLLTPDAGSRETYARIKGVDAFDATWRNIGRYMAATSGKARVKFILEEGNKTDIPAMIETSRKFGVQHLVLSLDMNIPPSRQPEYIAKAKEFVLLAHRYGMSVMRGAFLPEF